MMFRISKSTVSWAGVALAAILFTLAVPRAAHAVAAALVQVTNTAASPVISQGIGNQAAQIVEIQCGLAPGAVVLQDQGCVAVPTTGIVPAPSKYVVPYGETLVVTAVDILSGSGGACSSPFLAQVHTTVLNGITDVDLIRKSWSVLPGQGTVHFVYPSGILFSAGTSINNAQNGTNTCPLTLDMHGYLTTQ